MAVLTVPQQDENPSGESSHTSDFWCRKLEEGNILFFPATPIVLAEENLRFLRSLEQTGSGLHKNLAYKPALDRIAGAGIEGANPEASRRLLRILRGYSQAVSAFLAQFLSPYDSGWRLDYGSFRPEEEQGRDLPLRRRNDLLHTDAFPTRPTHGARILRFFNNLHPTRTRDWITGEPFGSLVSQFAPGQIQLPRKPGAARRALARAACAAGLGRAVPSLKRSPYDDFMMRFHNFLKENAEYQANGKREASSFPPGSSWMVYTDMVPHAVLAGQFALEQTFLVAPEVMVAPEHSPLGVLETMTGAKLV
jgi:hypothetical protein